MTRSKKKPIPTDTIQEAFPPSNLDFKTKQKHLNNIRSRIIDNDASLQGLLTFVPSFVVPDNHPMFEQVAYTNGNEMFFGDKFFSQKVPVQCAILIHEMLHIVFRHVSRGKKRIFELYNIAADAIINESIGFKENTNVGFSNYCYLEKNDVINLDSLYETYKIPQSHQKTVSHWTSETLYEFLLKEIEKQLEEEVKEQEKNKSTQGNKGQKSKGPNSGVGGKSSKEEEDGDSNSKKDSRSNLEKIEDKVRELMDKLAKKHKLIDGSDIKKGQPQTEESEVDDFKWTQRYNRAKAQSNTGTKSILGRINPDVYKPVIPWHKELRKYLVSRCMPTMEVCWQTPSRRMSSLRNSRTYLPGIKNKKGLDKMVVIVDTSGSCFNEEELSMFCSEIQSIQEKTHVEIALIFADTEVRNEYIVKSDGIPLLTKIRSGFIEAKGGGGTDMVVPFLYALNKYKPILLVITSDGMTPFPDKKDVRKTNLLWVLNTDATIPEGAGKALYINPK
jgi:predicted metal-dependent peptidase